MTGPGKEPRALGAVLRGVIPAALVAQLCSFGASLALAHKLGATSSTDAYFVGLAVPAMAYGILLAAMQLGAIPVLTDHRGEGKEAFARYSSEVVTATVVVSAALAVVTTGLAVLALPTVVGGSHHFVSLTRKTVIELAPLTVTGATTGALAAVLAAWGSFVPAAAVMAFDPLARIGLLLAFAHSLGTSALVIGNLIGGVLAVIVLYGIATSRGIHIRLVSEAYGPVVKKMLRLSTPLVVGLSVLQVNPLVDRAMASAVGPGSVTQLELALRLFAFPMSVITAGLFAPLTATWAARKEADEAHGLRESVSRATVALILIAPPIMVSGLLLGDEAISVIYGGGAYTAEALHRTADAFSMFVLGFAAQLVVVIGATVFVVERDTVFPMKIALANVVLNVGLNFALRPVLGTAGIALSTSLTFIILGTAYVVVAQRRWRVFDWRQLRSPLARASVATACAAGCGAALLAVVHFGSGKLGALAAVAAIGAVVAGVHSAVVAGGGGATEFAVLRSLGRKRVVGG